MELTECRSGRSDRDAEVTAIDPISCMRAEWISSGLIKQKIGEPNEIADKVEITRCSCGYCGG